MTEDDVAAYLLEHPDFFQRHLDLLEHLHIPHPSGNAVSLIAKQLEIFRTKHQEQENQLSALIDIARDNDAAFSRMHELTLAMLEADALENLVANLDHVLAECFMTDFVALKIVRENGLSPLSNLFVSPDCADLKLFSEQLATNQPKCGRPTLAQARFLFGEPAAEVKSCAIIPMVFVDLQALLAIGSREDGRFHYSMGSLFLTQMSKIIATRLISILHREMAG
ncbi:MAG: DUF484 family protein [Methylomonas sp.]|nr:DUF484 family protein [Methylomonas sp.]PPD21208.1 MAG: hypothetical protein CTY23_06135 [Methylomonas sp.]PPD27685.1 MAG: hypothetical protein CTY22_01315 [Methylomonas sp.]PPD38895.1 MAG: hypothetical protein CTY17_08800 [Methylomonas sp.]PPD39670.1 MAG: hypothetical protein CTY21_01310 [Methylomonas sp.]